MFTILVMLAIPAIAGAWLVLATPVGGWPHRIVGWTALGALLIMTVSLGLFAASPWFQQNNNWGTRDAAAVAAVQPYAFAIWIALIVALCFGTGGWLASVVRKNAAKGIVASLAVLIALPFGLFFSAILLGCFFAGACL